MKKILLIIACIVGVFSFVSCSDEEQVAEELKIVQSDVKFGCGSSEGYIEFTSPTAATATSSEDWCTTSVSGNQVIVSVTTNGALEGRNAVVTLSAAGKKIDVPVSQSGIIFTVNNDDAYLVSGTSANDVTISVNANYEFSATSEDSWIHPKIDGDNVIISFDDNTGKYRVGTVDFQSGVKKTSITIGQMNATDTADEGYYIAFYKTSLTATGWYYRIVTLTKDENGDMEMNGLLTFGSITFKYNSSLGYYELTNGSYVGTYVDTDSSTYECYNVNTFVKSASGTIGRGWTTSARFSVFLAPDIDPEDGSLYFGIAPYSKMSGYEGAGIDIYAFQDKNFSQTNAVGTLTQFFSLQLYYYQ
jgi:hypothetical protein